MKNIHFLFCLPVILVSCIKTTGDKQNQFINLSSGNVTSSACKTHFIVTTSPDSDFIEYSYSNKVLHITHINAAFNCCPGGIHYKCSTTNDSIVVNEMEEQPQCNCDCIYDLDYKLPGIPAGSYTLHITEPYKQDCDPPLIQQITLSEGVSGRFGAFRSGYPWGKH
jgi:hypothetical protein